MAEHDEVPAYWAEEKIWLVEIVLLDTEDGKYNLIVLNWIGRLAAFAFVTNARMLAQVGDPDVPAYELWFCFESHKDKRTFLEFVKADGYSDPREKTEFTTPAKDALAEVKSLRPCGKVFPPKQVALITTVMAATVMTLDEYSAGSKPN
jgi:hypothetical protein